MSSPPNSDLRDVNNLATTPRPSLSRAELLAWATVRTALGQMAFGAFANASLFGVLTLFSLLGERVPFLRPARGPIALSDVFERGGGVLERLFGSVVMEVLILFLAMGIVGGAVVLLAGVWTCCGAPATEDVRRWVKAARMSLICSVTLFFVGSITQRLDEQGGRNQVIQLGDGGLGAPGVPRLPPIIGDTIKMVIPYALATADLLAVVFFVLFLCRITVIAGGNNRQHAGAIIYLVAFTGLTMGHFALFHMEVSPVLAPHYPTLVFGAAAVMCGWFAMLTSETRSALTRMLLEAK